jgi:glycosyltransferase involved in cell wall biosynthesis
MKLALQSCLNQDYQALEIILVDDGSEAQISKEYLDKLEKEGLPRLKILRLENRYLGAARNSGIAAASGEYTIFLDDDNIALPDMVSRYVAAAQYSKADAVSGMMRFFYEQDGLPHHNSADNQFYSFLGGHQHYTAMLFNLLGDSTGIYRTEMLKKTGGFHEHFGVTHEDWKMYIDIESIGGKIATIPDMMFWYRINEGSMIKTTNIYKNVIQHLSAYERRLPKEWKYLPYMFYALNRANNMGSPNNISQNNNLYLPKYLYLIDRILNHLLPLGSKRRNYTRITAKIIWNIVKKLEIYHS